MRIAAFDDARLGVVANDDTVVDVTDLLQPYEPLGPEDLLPDLITHFDELDRSWSVAPSRAMASRLTRRDFVHRSPGRRRSSA